jgi:hypothetical protein
VPVWFEVLQVRRAQIFGSQGHSGHGLFSSIIRLIESRKMDPTPMIAARFKLEEVVEGVKTLSAKKSEYVKILIKP